VYEVKSSKALDTTSRPSRRHDRHDASRRRALRVLASGACLLVIKPAMATPDELATTLRETFGDRPIKSGRVKLEMPRLAENGSVVPVSVNVDSPMTPQDYVKSIHIFASDNHLPRVLEVQLGPYNGKGVFSSRVRVARSQAISAVAVMSDETVWSAAVKVEVVTSECGL
jgi:sulfur-oxidizing protein SoxY